MGENASASFEGVTVVGVKAVTVSGSGGEVKVGYFTDVSWRKISTSRGEDLMLTPDRGSASGFTVDERKLFGKPPSGVGGRPATSRASFLTRYRSFIPPQHARSVFQRTRRSYHPPDE